MEEVNISFGEGRVITPTHIIFDMKLSTFSRFYHLDEVLDYNGYLSTGGFSEVYDLSPYFDKECVLKVTDDEAYFSFLEFIKTYKNYPLISQHLPVIYDIVILDESDNVYGILMEKLTHHNFNITEYAETQGYWDKDPSLWWEYKELKPVMEELTNWIDLEEDNLNFDLREDNIMLRGNTLVVTDPFYID